MSKEEQIGKLYIQYHAKRKLIAELKYTRTIEFGECGVDFYIGDEFREQDSCYTELKSGNKNINPCENCKIAWDRHLEISKLGKQAGGLKNSLNKLISIL